MVSNPFWRIWIVAVLRNARSIFRRKVLNVFATCALVAPNGLQSRVRSNILGRFTRGDRFDSHGEERTQEKNSGTPKLRVSEPFVENPGGQRHRDRRTKKLESLGQRDSDFVYRHIIQNMSERDARYSRND